MDLFVFTAADRKGAISSKCSFECSTDGGQTFSPAKKESNGASQFSVPKLAETDVLTIRATPDDAKLWPATGTFTLGPQGSLVPKAAPPEFFLVAGTARSGADSTTLVYFFLSPFRDVTADALKKLLNPPAVTGPQANQKDRVNYTQMNLNWPVTSWSTPTLASFSVISQNVIDGADVSFNQTAGAASTTDRVLERRDPAALPKRFVVCWPNALARTVDSPPTPFLVFFTHLLQQNLMDLVYYKDYPDGWDYFYFAMLTYLNYSSDPLDLPGGGNFSRGLLYQLGASGKNVVLVLPVDNATMPPAGKNSPPEAGDCLSAQLLSDMLEEIQAFFFRQAGLFRAPKPELGRVAMASFSSGNNNVNNFLASATNIKSDFYLNVLQEVYCFDTPRAAAPAWAAFALQWAERGDKTNKIIRMYGTDAKTFEGIHKTLLAEPAPASAPYVSTPSTKPNRTVAVLPEASWRVAVKKPNVKPETLAQDVHQLMVGTLLTDALRRSKF